MDALYNKIQSRSQNRCELCSHPHGLSLYQIAPAKKADEESVLLVCEGCKSQIENPEKIDPNHWRSLSESMWSEFTPVKIMAWRMLTQLNSEDWARDLLDQLYLEDEALEVAKAGLPQTEERDASAPTLDSNGVRLQEGDAVTLIKDLEVKGAGFTAKRGTLVKNITLTDNPKHIEGRVNGIQIVLVAAYLKKA